MGVRQGDPLSPYLFILCPNELSLSLHEAEAKSSFYPIKLAKNDPGISHLFFADDILLFCRANPSHIHNLMALLREFFFQGWIIN